MKNIHTLIEEFENGSYQDLLLDIYADPALLEHQKERYIKALKGYIAEYGEADVEIYSAPGRSEVGGNHTDHQCGHVLAASVNLDVIAVVSANAGPLIQSKSEGYPPITLDVTDLSCVPSEAGTSQALIRGVAARLQQLGFKVGGFKAYMTSEVLSGSGLSSSAAFEVAIGNILSGLYNNMAIDAVTIAIAAQYAENVYFGKPCGLMDQMASSVGSLTAIDFKDSSSPVIRRIEADFSSYAHSLCIVDTKGSHANLTDCYAAIPGEMKAVAAYFGKNVLREVPYEDVIENLPALMEKLSGRAVIRALHFYEEDRRAIAEADALDKNDFESFLSLVRQSGHSSFEYLQNVYPAEMPQMQNLSIGLFLSEKVLAGRGACRVHGGGFAGTIQAFVPDDLVEAYRQALDACFGKGSCYVLKVRKYGGMKVL